MTPDLKPTSTEILARLRGSMRAALQWRLLLLWMAGLLAPTALMALPLFQLLSGQLDYSAHVPQLARALDLIVLTDLQTAAMQQSTLLGNAAGLAVVLTLLVSPWLTGTALTAVRSPGVTGLRELAVGGVREYPRMLRMLLLALVLLGAVGLLAAGLVADARASGSTGQLVFALLSSLLLWVLFHASLDAGRAMMALDRRRTSEVASWWLGCKLLGRRLWATLGAYAAISLAGLVAAALLSWLRLQVPGIGLPALLAGFVLSQAIVGALAWMRIARLFALVELAR